MKVWTYPDGRMHFFRTYKLTSEQGVWIGQWHGIMTSDRRYLEFVDALGTGELAGLRYRHVNSGNYPKSGPRTITGVYFYLSRNLYRSLDRALAIRSTQLCSIQDILESIRQGEFQEQLGEIVILYFYSGDQLVEVSAPGIGVSLSQEFVSKTIAGSSAFTTSQTTEGETLRLVAVSINLSMLGAPPGIQPAALVTQEIVEPADRATGVL